METNLTVKVVVDAVPALSAVADLARELVAISGLTAQCFEQSLELLALDANQAPASAAGDLRTVLQPTEKLILLVAALRACNRELRAVVEFETSHG